MAFFSLFRSLAEDVPVLSQRVKKNSSPNWRILQPISLKKPISHPLLRDSCDNGFSRGIYPGIHYLGHEFSIKESEENDLILSRNRKLTKTRTIPKPFIITNPTPSKNK